MLKGHTTIELTDMATGEKTVHEDDNMVTNAARKLLGYYGVFSADPVHDLFNNSDPYSAVKRLTGGLMLFDSTIEENADMINAPAGVSVVGCGSGEAYSGNNTMAGSYNQAESGPTEEGGYKHVWDFSTSQANGEISCACLTTRAGGKITEGTFPYSSDYCIGKGNNTADDALFHDNFIRLSMPRSYTNLLFVDGTNNRILFAGDNDFAAYYHSGMASANYAAFQQSIFYKKSMEIHAYRCGLTDLSLLDATCLSNGEEVITVEMPDELKALITQAILDKANYYWAAEICTDDDNIYIVIRIPAKTGNISNVSAGDSVHVWKINAGTFASSYYKVTNTTGKNVLFPSNVNNNSNNQKIAIVDKSIFVITDDGQVYSVNMENSVDISPVGYPDGGGLTVSGFLNTVATRGRIYTETSNYTAAIDTVTGKATIKNCTCLDLLGIGASGVYPKRSYAVRGTHFHATVIYTSSSTQLYLRLDPALLITINNLSAPVSKTAAQTMKVTYTLTEQNA